MKRMALVLAFALGGCTQMQRAMPEADATAFPPSAWTAFAQAPSSQPKPDPMSQLVDAEAIIGARPYIASCEREDAVSFIRSSFRRKGMVHGWMMVAIMSQNLHDYESVGKASMGGCEVDSYQRALSRLAMQGYGFLDPKDMARYYVSLPAIPDTLLERSTYDDEGDDEDEDGKG